jgi:hypothetical protein
MATGRIPTTANSPLTAKGDLFTFSTGSAKLAVGSDGDTLVADSSAATGLRWTENYAAGKSKIINGDFNINQRAFSSTTSSATYTFDRWRTDLSGGTVTYSAQTFTPGTAPVVGYESKNFLRIVTSGQSTSGDYALIEQRIEDVRTFANQTVTLSFWAKASTGTPKVGTTIVQNFGFGGSDIVIAKSGDVTISTSWARYSVTVAIPSISGKTVGTGSYLRNLLFTSAGTTLSSYTDIGVQNVTIDIWGVQVEDGSVATAFQTATGTLQGELAACQRYYYRQTGTGTTATYNLGTAYSTTKAFVNIIHPVSMRIVPTAIEVPSTITNLKLTNIAANNYTISAIAFVEGTYTNTILEVTASGMTTNQGVWIGNNSTTAGFIGVSAEL